MYVSVLCAWVLTLLWFNPRLASLYTDAHSPLGKVVLTLFIACLDVFWLYGSYYMMLFLFTLLSRRNALRLPQAPSNKPRVAILYLTLNDFQYDAALSCVSQDYGSFHVFVLDDSTREEKRREVDHFRDAFPERVTVVRRLVRTGFKAGSINHALRHSVAGYPYFAVIDADGVLPPDFLTRLMPHFGLDRRLAFVQGSHRPNPRQKSAFARDLCLGITPIWTVFLEPRNDYGFVMFLGHGGVILREAWERAGGFPEVVAEDLAFASKVRELGYHGRFVRDVVSYEDFPESYAQFRRQQEKYVKGGCEYIATGLRPFLRSKNIPWFEKVDVMMSCASLFVPAVHVLFIATFSLLLMYVLGERRPLTVGLGQFEVSLWDVYILRHSFEVIWTWDFYGITVLNMLAPMLGCISLVGSTPLALIRLLFLSAVPYLSLMVVCTMSIFTYALTGRAAFLVTGDTSSEGGLYNDAGWERRRLLWLERLNSGHPLTHAIELAAGVALSVVCLRTANVALFAFASCLILGYFVLRHGWDHRLLGPLLFVPFGLLLSSMALLGANIMGVQGVFLLFFLLHF